MADDARLREIVVAAQRGDAAALGELLARCADGLYGYLLVGLGDPHEAQDAVQHVLLKVQRGLGGFDAHWVEGFDAWLYTIARRELITLLRRRGRVVPHDPRELDARREGRAAEPGEWPALRDWLSRPALSAAVYGLPETQRLVIVLRYRLGLDLEEIALALGRRPGAVRQLHHRAITTLRHRLAGAADGEAR